MSASGASVHQLSPFPRKHQCRCRYFFEEEGSIAGTGNGVLEQFMKYHAVLTQLDLLAVDEAQVTNLFGVKGIDLHVS